MSLDNRAIEEEEPRAARWPMIGVHLGLLAVAFSAVYTPQPPGWFEFSEYVAFGAVGLALIVFALVRRRDGRGAAGSGLLALGAAAALWMAWDPQLVTLPGFERLGATALGALEPSLAHLGVIVATVFFALQMAVDRRGLVLASPFSGALVAAALLVIGLGILTTLTLGSMYDLTGTSGLALLSFRTITFTLLILVSVIASGVRGMGMWAHLYLGLALVGAVARNMVGGA